jgi:hypothetical protein
MNMQLPQKAGNVLPVPPVAAFSINKEAVMNKILIVLIILALINLYISCYRTVIKTAIDTKTNDVELYIVDRESRELIFEANMYTWAQTRT